MALASVGRIYEETVHKTVMGGQTDKMSVYMQLFLATSLILIIFITDLHDYEHFSKHDTTHLLPYLFTYLLTAILQYFIDLY